MTDFFKQFGLDITSRFIKNKAPHQAPSYSNATQIGLMISDEMNLDHDLLQSLKSVFEKDNKTVRMVFFSNSKESPVPECTDLTADSESLNFIGQVKDEEILSFAEESFDFLICLSDNITPFMRLVLNKSNAKCRILFGTEEHPDLFEFTIKPSEDGSRADLIKNLKQYISLTG